MLIKRPADRPKEGLLKFIAFKKPFEEVVKAETILEIENIKERTANDNFRISLRDRKELLIEGIAVDYDADDWIAGIEILDAVKRFGSKDVFKKVILEDLALHV